MRGQHGRGRTWTLNHVSTYYPISKDAHYADRTGAGELFRVSSMPYKFQIELPNFAKLSTYVDTSASVKVEKSPL